jgi:hypothetical protein
VVHRPAVVPIVTSPVTTTLDSNAPVSTAVVRRTSDSAATTHHSTSQTRIQRNADAPCLLAPTSAGTFSCLALLLLSSSYSW